MTLMALALILIAGGETPRSDKIDLASDARVVKYEGNSPETLQARAIERGVDGWAAWKGEDDQYMIGVEWDEPRDIAEVNIEFRHAIAHREKIVVQYYRQNWPNSDRGGWARLDDPFHGKWVSVKVADWWAGDRDVTLQFAPYNEEQPGKDSPDARYRRTYRLRFLLGKADLPPVRYVRAYGPGPVAKASFEVRSEADSRLKPPFDISVINGELSEEGDSTTTRSSQADRAPAKLRVRYAKGDSQSPNRTVVTVRSAERPLEGVSFLPEEAVDKGILRLPSLGVTIVHEGGTKDLQAGMKPGVSIMDRVEQEPEQTFERARREIPHLLKTKQRSEPMYLPLGPPGARQEIAVGYDGSILLDRSALKVPGADSERLQWPADSWRVRLRTGEPPFDQAVEGAVKQRLLDGYLPIVISTWETGGVQYEQACVATFLKGDPAELKGDEPVVLLSRLEMKNAGAAKAHAVARFLVEPGEALTVSDDGQVSATGKVVKDEKYAGPQHRFQIRAMQAGRLKTETTKTGDCVVWQDDLEPRTSETLTLAVAYVTLSAEEQGGLAKLDFAAVLEKEADRWRKIIARQAVIEVPNQVLSDFYKANLSHILIAADRDPFNGTSVLPAATYTYKVCINESCHQIRSLEMRGLHAEAQKYLDALIAGQSTMGLHGRFGDDSKGVIHGLPSKNGNYQGFNYNLDHGFAMWMLNEHYRFTRNEAWLKKNADALIAACDFVTRQRTRPEESDTLATDDARWGVGLMPPGHLEDPPEWLWWFAVNAYACRGMAASAESLAEIGHVEAARIKRDAEAFATQLRDSCREAMVRAPVVRLLDGTYVPHQPVRSRLRGRDLGWIRDSLYGPVHLIDCGVYPDGSPEAEWILRDTEDNVFISEDRGRKLTDFDAQWFSWGGITIQSNLLPNPLVYLRRNQPKMAVRAFFNSLAANVYEDVRTFCEHPVEAYGVGLGPFFKTPDESAFIVWLRSLLICENGENLEVLPGVPLEWLGDGKKITVRGAATWFGPMDLDVARAGSKLQITVKVPSRNPAKEVRVHLRRPQGIDSITVNSRAASPEQLKAGVFVLAGGH